MALTKCYECVHTISDKASSCPKCGAPICERQDYTIGSFDNPTYTQDINEAEQAFTILFVILASPFLLGEIFIVKTAMELAGPLTSLSTGIAAIFLTYLLLCKIGIPKIFIFVITIGQAVFALGWARVESFI